MLSFLCLCLGITCLFKSNNLTFSQEDDHYAKMIIALMLREGVKSCIADVVLRDRWQIFRIVPNEGGDIFSPQIYVADFGPLHRAFRA